MLFEDKMNATTIFPSLTSSSSAQKLTVEENNKKCNNEKQNKNTVMIPTKIISTTTITEPVLIHNDEGKYSSRLEVKNRTECISAVTGSVTSSEKDFHVVKIQISPQQNKSSNTEINNQDKNSNYCNNSDAILKLYNNSSNCNINNLSDNKEQGKKVSIVSFGSTSSSSPKIVEELLSKNSSASKIVSNTDFIENIDVDNSFEVKSNKSDLNIISNKPVGNLTAISTKPTALNETSKLLITSEMVEKPSGDLEVSNPTYLYYMMTSGQCSPSDTLDSGTCSDMENGSNINNNNNDLMTSTSTSPPLPKKMQQKLKINNQKNREIITTEENLNICNNNNNNINNNNKNHSHNHNRTGSYTEDSEESESSLSCDSLNSSEFARNSMSTPTPPSLGPFLINNTNNIMIKNLKSSKLSFLPDSLLRDIRDRKFNNGNKDSMTKIIENVDEIDGESIQMDFKTKLSLQKNLMDKLPNESELRDRNKTCALITQENEDNKKLTRSFENDKFYKFHVNEKDLNQDLVDDGTQLKFLQDDESFAGYKDIHSGTSTIRSSKGTVRGVKNRVRNGIATFLQMQHTNLKNYKEKDSGKVVLYTTSMGVVRETYAKCSNVKQILRTLLVKFEERDVFMSNDYQQEIKERMQSDEIQVPQLFVEGQHIGDAETVERLNESGELRKMLKPYKSMNTSYTCQICGGYRLLPCPSCNGSKKSVHRNHFTAEFVALKCMNCDEVGLVKCHNC